jgi:soluble lytic murein transglycosylase-like protein
MRAGVIRALLVMLIASPAVAQVQLMVNREGKKVIYNVPSGPPGGANAGNLKWLAKQRNRRTQFDALIDRYAAQYGVDPVLVRAVIQVESDFNPMCVSNKGARGLMQLMPETARRYGVRRVHDPEDNIRGGVAYLAFLLNNFSNDLPRVLAAYNAGEGAVAKYAGIPPYSETMTYVKRALTVYYGRPYGSGSTSFPGSRGKGLLRGGFKAAAPLTAAAIIPGFRYLGSR